MTALPNFLADLDSVTFHIGLTTGVICLSIVFWVIGIGQTF